MIHVKKVITVILGNSAKIMSQNIKMNKRPTIGHATKTGPIRDAKQLIGLGQYDRFMSLPGGVHCWYGKYQDQEIIAVIMGKKMIFGRKHGARTIWYKTEKEIIESIPRIHTTKKDYQG